MQVDLKNETVQNTIETKQGITSNNNYKEQSEHKSKETEERVSHLSRYSNTILEMTFLTSDYSTTNYQKHVYSKIKSNHRTLTTE